ncbi:MAG: hypothetical protein N2645_23855 [Clostridia bacterium]|nr:hypothetical protein [Clostridia bacterium]
MLPIQIAGLALAAKTIQSKYAKPNLPGERKITFSFPSKPKLFSRSTKPISNPFQTLFKGLTDTLTQMRKASKGEDYQEIVKNFIPQDAKLLVPQYPPASRNIQLVDLDGDTQPELITSYRLNNGINTLVLKKQNGTWYKAAEFSNSEHDTINFRDARDITGEGKRQLIMGYASDGKIPILYGYSLENDSLRELFARNYHKFEVVPQNTSSQCHLAIWNKGDQGNHIELLGWDGSTLAPLPSSTGYYSRNVVPYYIRKIKQTPYTPSIWFDLAEALNQVGANRDALAAAEIGLSLDSDSNFKEKYSELRSKILGE